MAVGGHAAVVIRARAPKQANLIVQAQGFDARIAINAAKDAADILNDASGTNDMGDITVAMPGLPLACGSVLVEHGRLRVMYRMVGNLMVMVITPATANALSTLDLLDRSVRVVTFDFKSPELSVDRFAKRYQEVYMALSILLANSGCVSAGKALTDGRFALDAIINSAVAKKRESATGKDASQHRDADGVESGTVYGQGGPGFKARRRTLASQAGQLPIQFGFPTQEGMKGLRPLPGFEPHQEASKPSAKKAVPTYALHQFELLPEQVKAAVTENSDISPLDDLLGPPAQKKDKEQGPKKGEDPFAFVEAALTPEKKDTGPQGPPPPPTPNRPLLRLIEASKSEVKGNNLVRAGHVGEVSWLPEVSSTMQPVVGFALQYNPRASHNDLTIQAVEAALQSTRALPSVIQPGWPAGYQPAQGNSDTGGEADLQGLTAHVAPSRSLLNPVILRYHIPTAPQPVILPIRALLNASMTATPSGTETAVLMGLQLQISQELEPLIAGVEIRLHIPTLYELPARCRPKDAQLDGGRRILKWQLTPAAANQPAVQPKPDDTSGFVTLHDVCRAPQAFSAAFLVSGSPAACKGVLRTALAEVEVRGQTGSTLSGVMLRQHGFVGPAVAPSAMMCSWKASVTARFP